METVLVSTVISNALIAAFIAVLWHQHRKRYAGLSFWLADYVLQLLGFVLLALRTVVPDLVSIVAANAMIAAGIVLIFMGLERFLDRPRSQIHNYILVAVSTGLMSYFTIILPDMEIRTMIVNGGILVLTLQCAWLMLRKAGRSLRPITRGVGIVFLGYSAVALIRIVHLAMKPLPAATVLFDMPGVQAAYILLFQMLNIALTFALVLMVTRRLSRDVQTQEQNYASLYGSMREGMALNEIIYTVDEGAVDYRVLDVNPAYETILGIKRKDVVGRTGSTLYGPDFARNLHIYADVAATRRPASFETYIPSMDRHFRVSVFSPEAGQFATVFQDVTESKQAEALLGVRLTLLEFSATHTLAELLQKALDEVGTLTDSPIGFYHFVSEDQQSLTLQAWSTRTVREFCRAEGRGMHYGIDQAGVWVDCVHEKRPVIHNDYESLPHRKGLPEGHAQVIRELVVPIMRFGKIVAILGVGNKPVDYTDRDVNTVSYLADVAWEITRRKQAEEAVRESEAKFRGVFETSRDFTFISSLDGEILDSNEPVRGFFGYSSEEIRTMNISNFYADPDERERFKQEVIRKGYVENYPLKLKKKDGTLIDSEVTVVVRKDTDGHVVGFQGSVRDMTEKRKMERQLLQSEKLSTIGTMVSGVAHELNNPLTAVIGNTQLLMGKADSDEVRAKLNTVFREAKRAAGIVGGLLSFAREHKLERRATKINEIITESLGTADFDTKSNNIRLRLSLAGGLPDADCDPFQIKQAFITLVSNAYDALLERGGGTINIRTFLRGHSIIIECEDDGPGIPPDLVKRVFDPFFTTKEVGKGTGLGLSMAYGIIKDHDGEISVESQPDKGTKFIIDLPIAASEPEKTRTSTHEVGHVG